MAEPMIINIPDLRTALTRTLDLAEARLGSTVELDADYCWHLAVDDAFDIANEPTAFTIGQVSDDLLEIHAATTGFRRRRGTTSRIWSVCSVRSN